MAEFNVTFDYEVSQARLYFTRRADWQNCINKITKLTSDFEAKENKEGDSFTLSFDLKYSSPPKSLIRGLPRGISKINSLKMSTS